MSRRLVASILIPAALAACGCANQAELVHQREIIARQIRDVDSLRITQRMLMEHLDVLTDSLQFIDDVRTGRYYRERRSLQDRITRLEYDLQIGRDGITVATLLVDDLFAPASADLTPAGTRLLDQLAGEIAEQFEDHMLYVEGHADTVALGPALEERYGSNWGLSTFRASAVVEYLIREHQIDETRIAAVGYGDARPIASNESPEGRRTNRRLRIAAHPL